MDKFVYLDSLQSSNGYCHPDVNHRTNFTSSTMASLGRIWKDIRLTEPTKIHLYQALVLSVLTYAAETWTLLAADTRALEAFHVRCQRQILGVRWFDFIRNDEIALRTGLPSPSQTTLVAKRWRSVFSHITHLSEAVGANQALCCHVDASLGRPPHHSWKRRPTQQLAEANPSLQLIYGIGQSSADMGRCYSPGWLRDNDLQLGKSFKNNKILHY